MSWGFDYDAAAGDWVHRVWGSVLIESVEMRRPEANKHVANERRKDQRKEERKNERKNTHTHTNRQVTEEATAQAKLETNTSSTA